MHLRLPVIGFSVTGLVVWLFAFIAVRDARQQSDCGFCCLAFFSPSGAFLFFPLRLFGFE